jgi:hypothetical protein
MHCSPAFARHVREGLSRTRGRGVLKNKKIRVAPHALYFIIIKQPFQKSDFCSPTFFELLWSFVRWNIPSRESRCPTFLSPFYPA